MLLQRFSGALKVTDPVFARGFVQQSVFGTGPVFARLFSAFLRSAHTRCAFGRVLAGAREWQCAFGAFLIINPANTHTRRAVSLRDASSVELHFRAFLRSARTRCAFGRVLAGARECQCAFGAFLRGTHTRRAVSLRGASSIELHFTSVRF